MTVCLIMFAYVGVFGYLIQYYHNNSQTPKYDSKISLFGAVLVFALPVFFIGMRTDFGDTHAYITDYNELSLDFSQIWENRQDTKGIGFDIYMYIIKRYVSSDYNVFLMITASIQAIGLIKLYYKYSINYTYSVLLFFLSMSFTNMMNGMRQFLAASIIFLFVDYLFKKKALAFIFITLIAFSIHASAIVWIPIFFVVQGKPWNIKMIFSMLLVVVAIFTLDTFTDILSDSLEGTNYEGYTNQFAKDDGASFIHTIIAAIPALLALWKRKDIEAKGSNVVYILINCSIAATMINLLANFTSGILIGRIPSYFTPFGYVLLPWLFENVMEDKDKRLVRSLCLIFYLLYALYYMYSQGTFYMSEKLGISNY